MLLFLSKQFKGVLRKIKQRTGQRVKGVKGALYLSRRRVTSMGAFNV